MSFISYFLRFCFAIFSFRFIISHIDNKTIVILTFIWDQDIALTNQMTHCNDCYYFYNNFKIRLFHEHFFHSRQNESMQLHLATCFWNKWIFALWINDIANDHQFLLRSTWQQNLIWTQNNTLLLKQKTWAFIWCNESIKIFFPNIYYAFFDIKWCFSIENSGIFIMKYEHKSFFDEIFKIHLMKNAQQFNFLNIWKKILTKRFSILINSNHCFWRFSFVFYLKQQQKSW